MWPAPLGGSCHDLPRHLRAAIEPEELAVMGFFSEFTAWLNGILGNYIGATTARIAAVLEPAVVTLGVLYLMIWGYLQLAGKVDVKPHMRYKVKVSGDLHGETVKVKSIAKAD